MQISLVVVRGSNQGLQIPIERKEFCIGRDSSCDWQTYFLIVSRRHAAIVVRDHKVLVRDLGSRNGTFVNGRVVMDECEVRHDDRLAVGPFEFRVQMQPPAASSDATLCVDLDENRPAEFPPYDSTGRNRPLVCLAQDAAPPRRHSPDGLLRRYLPRWLQ
jgi:pSer/pThr/pTyr-binding forkhead associated (FHA) protein